MPVVCETAQLARVGLVVAEFSAKRFISDRERPQYLLDGKITPEGRTRIDRLMIG